MVITRELVEWNEDKGSIFIVYSSFTELCLLIRTVKTGLATSYNHIPFNITEFDRFTLQIFAERLRDFHRNILDNLQRN